MKEKRTVLTAIGIILAVICTMALYMLGAGELGIGEYSTMIIALLIVAGAVWFVKENITNIRKGLPTRDERSERINHRAGYYGFIAAIWIALGAAFLSEEGIILPDQVYAVVILGAVLVFVLSYIILARRSI